MVGANRNIFFPPGEESVLTVFIAWLNLDIGIQTCFFEGMDAYSKTWLQFAFPVYIWLLVLLIAVSSHYSSTVAKLIGSTNPVSILVTLFLLSYTKLLRTIIAAFSFTTLEYENDNTQVVWLYDGSVAYLAGKHIALFLISLVVFLVLFVPYTLILLLGQWIQARTNCGCVSRSCYLRMNFFLDAYHAPYKKPSSLLEWTSAGLSLSSLPHFSGCFTKSCCELTCHISMHCWTTSVGLEHPRRVQEEAS